MFTSSILLVLALTLPAAHAKAVLLDLEPGVLDAVRATLVTTDTATAMVSLEVSSDSGSEDVILTESDAWLHGAATVKALPAKDAELSITLYDEGSASLATFSGTLGGDGSASLSRGKCYCDPGFEGAYCEKETVCDDPDIDVLAAELFPNPDGGYDLGIDFNGADAYDVAYAEVAVTEGGTSTTKAEVYFDAIGATWEGELGLDPEGEVEIDVTSYDVDGKKLETSSVSLAQRWHLDGDDGHDDHYGLSAGDAGSVAVVDDLGPSECWDVFTCFDKALVVVSDDDWTTSSAPTHASVELDGGETLTIPANSFQRPGFATVDIKASEVVYLGVVIDGGNLTFNGSATISLSDLAAPVCVNGTCVAVSANETGALDLSATAYASSAAEVASSATIGVIGYDKAGRKVASTSTKISFETAVGVVFANGVTLAEDPVGVDLGGQVSLLGAADSKGKQKTLAKGDFYGSFVRASDGELTLGGVDKNVIDAKGDILIGGEPIDFERADTDKDGVIEAPPVVLLRVYSNGKGTRVAATANNGSPGLL